MEFHGFTRLPASRRITRSRTHSGRGWNGSGTRLPSAVRTRSARLKDWQPSRPQLRSASRQPPGPAELWRAPAWCQQPAEAAGSTRKQCPISKSQLEEAETCICMLGHLQEGEGRRSRSMCANLQISRGIWLLIFRCWNTCRQMIMWLELTINIQQHEYHNK